MVEWAPLLRRVREILAVSGDRVGKARRISAAIRETGGYPWVGIYDAATEGGPMAWSGPIPGTAGSKLVVPVVNPAGGEDLGLLGVESDLPDAFGEADQRCLEECAAILAPLWD